MPLEQQYDPDFLDLLSVYPKWPTGRTVKKLAYAAYLKAKKLLKLNHADIQAIKADIIERCESCETWQPGNKFGPPAFQVYLNQHRWNEPYVKVRGKQHTKSNGTIATDEDNRRAWALDQQAKGLEIPPNYQQYVNH